MSRFILTGAGGQLGRSFQALLDEKGLEYLALDQAEADFSKPESLSLPVEGARAVINCAAYTNVDAAETDEDAANRVNGEAVGVIAEACRKASVPILHFSTDYVFEGKNTEPYTPSQPRNPIGAYGRSKALGEEALIKSGAEHLIVRTSWVYAPWGNNFALTMARLMKEKDELKVVDDQRGRPTQAQGLAARSLALFDGGARGIHHITDGTECTWFGFAQMILEATGASCKLTPCTTEEFPRPAPRPAYSVLSTRESDALLPPALTTQEWLKKMASSL